MYSVEKNVQKYMLVMKIEIAGFSWSNYTIIHNSVEEPLNLNHAKHQNMIYKRASTTKYPDARESFNTHGLSSTVHFPHLSRPDLSTPPVAPSFHLGKNQICIDGSEIFIQQHGVLPAQQTGVT